jgi:integrase
MRDLDTTADVERRITKHLTPYFHDATRMVAITTTTITAFAVARKAPGASNGEVNRELAILKRAFSLSVKAGTLTATPHFPILPESHPRSGFFDRAEFDAVRTHLSPVLQRVAMFSYLTGWRTKSEVLTLEWRQVDFERGLVVLDAGSTKNDQPRQFLFGDMLPELRDLPLTQQKETKRIERERGVIVAKVFHRNGKTDSQLRRGLAERLHRSGLSPGADP